MLKQTIIAGAMLSLSISSMQAIASYSEFVLCPPVAQCVDNVPAHCSVGGSWILVRSSEKVKVGIYALRSAWQNIWNPGSNCLYSIIENNYSSGLIYSRNDLRNVLPAPGNFWSFVGENAFSCEPNTIFPPPSDCPFIKN